LLFQVSDGHVCEGYGVRIEALTPDVEREMEVMRMVEILNGVDWKRMPFAMLQDIVELVEHPENDKRREG